jgi:hypothetical protein
MADESKMKVLRSVFLDPMVDEVLRRVAFHRKVSEGELIRNCVERGLRADPYASGLSGEHVGNAVESAGGRPLRCRNAPRASRKVEGSA